MSYFSKYLTIAICLILSINTLKVNIKNDEEVKEILINDESGFDFALENNDSCILSLNKTINLATTKAIESKQSLTIDFKNYSINFINENDTTEAYLFNLISSNLTIIKSDTEDSQIYSSKMLKGYFSLNNSKLEINSDNSLTLSGNISESFNIFDSSSLTIEGKILLNSESIGIKATDSNVTLQKGVEINSKIYGIEMSNSNLKVIGADSDGNYKEEDKVVIGDTSTKVGIKFSKNCAIELTGMLLIQGTNSSLMYNNSISDNEDTGSTIDFITPKNLQFKSDNYETFFKFNETESFDLYYNEVNDTKYETVRALEIITETENKSLGFKLEDVEHKTSIKHEDLQQYDTYTNSEITVLELLNQGSQEDQFIKQLCMNCYNQTEELFSLEEYTQLSFYKQGTPSIDFTFNRELFNATFILTGEEAQYKATNYTKNSEVITLYLDLDNEISSGVYSLKITMWEDQLEVSDLELEINVFEIKSLTINDNLEYDTQDDIMLPLSYSLSQISYNFNTDLNNHITVTDLQSKLHESLDWSYSKEENSLVITLEEGSNKCEGDDIITLDFQVTDSSQSNIDYEFKFTISCLNFTIISTKQLVVKETTEVQFEFNHELEDNNKFQLIDSENKTIDITNYELKSQSGENYIYSIELEEDWNLYGEYQIKYIYGPHNLSYTASENIKIYKELSINSIKIGEIEFNQDQFENIVFSKAHNISLIQVEFTDELYDQRISIGNSEGYAFTISLNEQKTITDIYTNDLLNTKNEEEIVFTITDSLNTEQTLTFTLKFVYLKKINPTNIVFAEETEQKQINLTYNRDLENLKTFSLIKFNETHKEIYIHAINQTTITTLGDGLYSFNIDYDENLFGNFAVKTMFENDYYDFTNESLVLYIRSEEEEEEEEEKEEEEEEESEIEEEKEKEKEIEEEEREEEIEIEEEEIVEEEEEKQDEEEEKTNVAVLIAVLAVLIVTVLIIFLILFCKKGKKDMYKEIAKTSFAAKDLAKNDDEKEVNLNEMNNEEYEY